MAKFIEFMQGEKNTFISVNPEHVLTCYPDQNAPKESTTLGMSTGRALVVNGDYKDILKKICGA